MALRTAARLACLCTRKPAASVPLLARGLASVQPGVGVLGQLAQRPVLGQAAAPAGWAAARRPAGLLLLRTTHSAPEQGAKKRDADELIKGYLLKASAVVAGVGVGCVLVPALALVAAGGMVVGLGAMGLVALRYRKELGAMRAIYQEHKKVMESINTLGVRPSDVQRQQQLQQQLTTVFPPGHKGFGLPALLDAAFQASAKTFESAQEVVKEVQDLAVQAICKDGNTRRIIGEQATGQACTEIEHHTVDGFTQVKIVFPVQGNMGSGRAFVKAEKDEEGTVLKSIKVIENRTGRPYRVYVRPRPPRVIDADYQDVPS
eukprot:comp23258_c0_seq1/m.38011 comp23258_c0_seq1/g.38011  ORF comp23258_c0_seq1/g.38011 comp23258_c0_seq1/m.38011 type:complete len:318 (-) comp23258_c0_seq1:72-1025(-)